MTRYIFNADTGCVRGHPAGVGQGCLGKQSLSSLPDMTDNSLEHLGHSFQSQGSQAAVEFPHCRLPTWVTGLLIKHSMLGETQRNSHCCTQEFSVYKAEWSRFASFGKQKPEDECANRQSRRSS